MSHHDAQYRSEEISPWDDAIFQMRLYFSIMHENVLLSFYFKAKATKKQITTDLYHISM